MRKEPIVKYDGNELEIVGYEILADFPQLIVNEDIDYKTFLINLKNLEKEPSEERTSLYYYLNLSGKTLLKYKKGVVDNINTFQDKKDNIVIELLEDFMSQADEEEVLNFLHQNSIKISLDDFGTVSSNFNRLIKYKDIIESVKIDRIVWINLKTVVKELIGFCNQNNMDVIIEKVETKEELDELVSLGAKYFQGWYFKEKILKEENLLEKYSSQLSLDINSLVEIFKKAVDLADDKGNLFKIIRMFEVLLFAKSLNIDIHSSEFKKLAAMLTEKHRYDLSKLDERFKHIIKILASEHRFIIKDLKKIINDLKIYLYDTEVDNNFFLLLKKLTEKLDYFEKVIKNSAIELNVMDFMVEGIPEKHLRDAKQFDITLNTYFKNFKDKKEKFVAGLIYIPTLKEILNSYGYYKYYNAWLKVVETMKTLLSPNDLIFKIDDYTLGVIYKSDSVKKLIRLKDRLTNIELEDIPSAIFKIRAAGVVSTEKDEKPDDFKTRLNGSFYESLHYGKDNEFVEG